MNTPFAKIIFLVVVLCTKLGLSSDFLANSDDVSRDLSTLVRAKSALEAKIAAHQDSFKNHASVHKKAWRKKIKSNPRARFNYENGLYLTKKLKSLEQEIARLANQRRRHLYWGAPFSTSRN